ncbi:FAD-binding oxidoreductase [Kribbella jejuensis]|uniref:FAD/FMN-containing dehydrogenase n=1 Tax=Kribbella jejuensis TaxID=236068 RepID=A0A542EQW9_9ACTN|nr:FAD-binding oxidoreductase [Kribbella jejuensis]TQJ17757.1 FAD/FMN-containing dehydrogenase [Kribbella jejuensis]
MFEDLGRVLSGRLVTPGEVEWEQVRRGWNLSVDQRPAAVVEAADPKDVERVVAYAGARGLKVAAQAGGHGATRALDGAIVVRTGALDDIWIDSDARVARVGAGVRWGAVQTALDGTGLTGLPGTSGNVSVAGFCTNGGFSWFARPYGSGAASLRAAEIVDATGERRWIDDASDADLMWALRGGGGNFGVLTAVEVDLHPAPAITGARLMFPIEQAEAVLTAYGKATQEAAPQVTLWAYLIHYPDVPAVPDGVRGKSFCMVDGMTPYHPEAMEAALSTVRAAGTPVSDTVQSLQPSGVGELNAVPAPPQALSLISSTFDELTPDLIRTLMEYCGQPSLIFQAQVRHLRAGAGVRRPGVAAADPAAQYMVLAVSIVQDPQLQPQAIAALRTFQEALTPWHAGAMPPTGLSAWGSLQECYSSTDLARLRQIKLRVDPDDMFVGNFRLP